MAVHFIPLPQPAPVEYQGRDGNQTGGHAFAVEMTDSGESHARAWIIKPNAGRPGDVDRVDPSKIVRFAWR
jgi:hypothetical protein